MPDAVYSYRDTGSQPDDAARALAAETAEPDASYWYDLSGEDGGSKQDSNARKDTAEQIRGPFEPLISSTATAPPSAAYPAADTPTAEASGEQHVDEHFDQFLAQQRELINEYIRQSGDHTSQAARQASAEAARQAQNASQAPAEGRRGHDVPWPLTHTPGPA